MQDWKRLGEQITEWILDYATSNGITTLVVGVSVRNRLGCNIHSVPKPG